jgi:hypothetical protein
MRHRLNVLADRILEAVAPGAEALAACSGCYTTCVGLGCDMGTTHPTRFQWRCCYKPNCTDSCYYLGGFPYCCY